jgi:hypothetical protein
VSKRPRHGQLALPADEAAVFVPIMMAAQKPVATTPAITIENGWDRGSGRMRRGCRLARGCAAGEGPLMIVPSGAVRVLVATRPVDFRKGMDGRAALMRDWADSGVMYVFRAKPIA